MRYVENGLEKARLRDFITDKYGEKAIDSQGHIKLSTLRNALNSINPDEEPELYSAIRLEMSLNDEPRGDE